LREGKRSLRYHGSARPAAAEAEAVGRGLLFSRLTGSPIYFVHLSSPLSVRLVDEARTGGIHALAETCPHYLVLDESRYATPEAARYLMTPPLRDLTSQAQLWRQLQLGQIQSIGSDHCGFALADREDIDDFSRISPGVPGVETSLLMIHSFGVKQGRLSLPQLVELLSQNPAKIFGLWPRKGTLAPGSDADIVLFDPRPQRSLAASELHSRAGFSPYEGLMVTGWVVATILRGQVVYRDGRIIGQPGSGHFQRCAPFDWNAAPVAEARPSQAD
jgi:dihydropyrimidinase